MCCSLTKTFDTKCGEFGGCQQQHNDPTSRCIVGQILERYSQAGIPALKADKVKTSCISLFKLYRDDIKKHASRENPGESKGAFGNFCKELDLCLLRIDYRRHVIELEVKHNIHHRKEYIGTRRRLVQTIP